MTRNRIYNIYPSIIYECQLLKRNVVTQFSQLVKRLYLTQSFLPTQLRRVIVFIA